MLQNNSSVDYQEFPLVVKAHWTIILAFTRKIKRNCCFFKQIINLLIQIKIQIVIDCRIRM